ncbi:HEAT repeat domain-containing protein [candidate division KSB1 bacterium]|nr:HEAT repeat domain-containing protein [candidate division KSB1 bacterium]
MSHLKKVFSVAALAVTIIMIANFSFVKAYMPENSNDETISQLIERLTEIKNYDYGSSRESLTQLSDLIRSSLDNPELKGLIEKEMLNFLNSDALFAGKQFVCQQISIIGTDKSVPTLAKMLTDEKTADIALYALERIPGSFADEAILKALAKAKGKTKIGIINTLGQKKVVKSVKNLGKLVYDPDPAVAEAAIAALGKIGNDNATDILAGAKDKISGNLRHYVLDAYLKCADKLAARDKTAQANSIFQSLYKGNESIPVRAAALRGLVQTNKQNAVDIILNSLKSDPPELHPAAIGLIRELSQNTDLQPVIVELPNLSIQGKIQLISAFSDRGELSARSAVVAAVTDNEQPVRVAALKALANVGNDSDIALLTKIAAETKADEQEAARVSLNLLHGASIDRNIIAQIPDAETDNKVELIRSVAERNIVAATNTLLKTAADPERSVRRESYKSLAVIAGPESINDIIQLLIREENNTIRNEAEITVVAIAQKSEDNQAKPVLDILPSVDNIEAKSSLLEVLGKIGDKNCLPVLKQILNSDNADLKLAAISALSNWPDAEPAHDLLNIAKNSVDETQRILALRGYIGLLKIESDRSDAESLKLYQEAMTLATELNEKRLVLSGMANLKSMAALEATAMYLDDPNLQPEAEVAAVSLAGHIENGDTAKIREILIKITNITENTPLRDRVDRLLERLK